MSSGAAVNVPTNYKVKEADVNAKLQLYGIYSAFANGKAPSNKQIDIAMNSVLQKTALTQPNKKLSPEGQKLVSDLRHVIEQAKVLLLTKNEGNLLQDFIWQTQQVSGGDAQKPNAPIDADTAKQHGNQALEGLRTLGTLLISNGQFRKLLQDATVLLRDIAGDAAQKAATRINPNEEQLSQIDRPAEDNTWHDVPDMSKDNLRSQWNERKPFNKGDAKEQARNVGEDARQNAEHQGQRSDGTVDRDTGAQGARAGAQTVKDNLRSTIQNNVSDEDQEKAKGTANAYREKTNNYLQSKVPQERRDQTIWRLKKMVAEIQGHQDYQQAIETLLRLAEEYAGHGKNVAGQGTNTVKGAHTDNSLKRAETDLKTIIERFANSTSLDDVFDSVNQIYRDADRDPELKDWFKKIDRYIRRCLQEQGFVLQDSATDEWNQLYDQGNFLLRDRYRQHTDRVIDELKWYGEQFDKDPQNKAFGESMNKLFLDLGNDENGQPQFKPHLVKDLTDVILPAFFENIRYVPIPRIEFKDPMIDMVVENLVIEGDNLAPNVLEFGSDNFWRWGRKSIASKNKNKVMLAVSGVQCDLRDVSYYVKKKQGFPGVTDKGVMDVVLGGQGLSFKVAMETADKQGKDRTHFFKVEKVDVSLKNMNIILKQSNHKLLFKIFKPLLLKVMNPVIQKAVEKQVRDSIQQLDSVLWSIHQEAEKAKRSVKDDPQNAQNFYQRYTQAANQRMTQAKQKKNEAQKNNQVNVAVTQHESIFPEIKLPGGISTKATEYKDLARKGDKWESPVFSIGSGKESTGLPRLPQVSRKSRNGGGLGGSSTGTGIGSGSSAPSGQGYGSGSQGAPSGQGYDGAGQGYGSSGGAVPGNALSGQGNSSSGGQDYGSQGHNTSGGTYQKYGPESGSTGAPNSGFSNQVDQAFNKESGLPNGSAPSGPSY